MNKLIPARPCIRPTDITFLLRMIQIIHTDRALDIMNYHNSWYYKDDHYNQ